MKNLSLNSILILAFFLGFLFVLSPNHNIPIAEAAIARSGVSSTCSVVATTCTFAHDNGSPTNGLTVVSAGNLQGTNNLVRITYASSAMTQVNAVDGVINNWLYAKTNPPAGSNNVFVEFDASQSIRASAVSYSGVTQSLPPDSNSTWLEEYSALREVAVSTTVIAANSWLVMGVLNDSAAISASSGSFEVANGGAGSYSFFDSNGVVGTGAQTLAISWGAANGINANIMSISPASEAAATVRKLKGRGVTR